ncbi:MAG: fatty acid desaturase [Proteobacteria bacterium]|nr:fatty acid desaturase [Pseudomonadota bacterium]
MRVTSSAASGAPPGRYGHRPGEAVKDGLASMEFMRMTLDVRSLRRLVDDLRAPRPRRYLLDMVLAASASWATVAVVATTRSLPLRLLAGIVAAFLLYRAVSFIHEFVHQPQLDRLRWLWHAAVGVPMLLPLLIYQPVHRAHHGAKVYGTKADGEYEDFGGRLFPMVAKTILINLVTPVALLLRFMVLVPLAALVPWVRREILPSAVHLSLRVPHRVDGSRPVGTTLETTLVEWACFAWASGLVLLAVAGHPRWLLTWAALLVAVAMLNTVRFLCATHRYLEQPAGRETAAQIDDSVNVSGGVLAPLLCPVGLRYHALHHLAPFLPYHALPEAHRRIMAALPASSSYHRATVANMREGWRRIRAATRQAGSVG